MTSQPVDCQPVSSEPGVSIDLGQLATLACIFEVSTPKVGNVHRGADFEDVTFGEFLASAVAIGPVIRQAGSLPLGQIVLQSIEATRNWVASNTNLGTVLLLAPLAKGAALIGGKPREDGQLRGAMAEVLRTVTPKDAENYYEAIRMAEPGGMGRVDQGDIQSAQSPEDLLTAMQWSADRDLVARQYTNGFAQVFDQSAACLRETLDAGWTITDAILWTQMHLMQQFPDSLIARKCGARVAQESSDRAAQVLRSGRPGQAGFASALSDLDFWLRADGHRRNPGTTADLIAAGLFVGLVEGWIPIPFWSARRT